MNGWRAIALLALVLWSVVAPAASGADDEPLVLEVQLDRQRVSDLPALHRGERVLLPLGQLCDLLTIAIHTDPQAGTATGFVLHEDRPFQLDAAAGVVTLSFERKSVDTDLVSRQPDDLYVDTALLSVWLPLDLAVDLPSLTLSVIPRESLPLQALLERQRRGALLTARDVPTTAAYPRRNSPYRIVETPFIDASLEALGDVSARSADARYSMFLTGDLLWMEGALYAAGSVQENSHQVRGSLQRNDPEGGLLGPLDARSVGVGNVAMPGLPYISRPSADGLGAYVSNRTANQSASLGRHSLQGDLPPGWDVELYLNDVLIGLQQPDADQRYRFADLVLGFGVNEFSLVFHGPQGQERVERSTVLLEGSVTPAGHFDYRVSALRSPDGDPHAEAQFDFGLTSHISATAGFAALTTAGSPQRYVLGGLRGLWGPLLLNADYIHSLSGGSLFELGARVRVRAWTLGASQTWMDRFRSEIFPTTANAVRQRQEVHADGYLPLPGSGRLRVGVAGRVDTLQSGARVVQSSARASAFVNGTALSNEVRWQDSLGTRSLDGSFQGSRRIGGIGLRGQIGYAIQPRGGFTTVAVSADRRLGERYILNFSATRAIATADTAYALALNKTQGRFAFGVVGRYSSLTGAQIGINLFVSAGRDPVDRDWNFSALPAADNGSIAARVFVDRNGNGVADDGEEPVPNAEFTVNGGRRTVKTNGEGKALLERLPSRDITFVRVEPTSLEDPQLSPPAGGVRMVPRPGHVSHMDFPVLPVGEVEGSVYVARGDGWTGAAGIDLELQDPRGQVVARAQSAPDGYYLFSSVPPGTYGVSLAGPAQSRQIDAQVRTVSITADTLLVSGFDFRLTAPEGQTHASVEDSAAERQAALTDPAVQDRHAWAQPTIAGNPTP